MSDNFKNYFFASAFVLLWEFVTDDEGKLVRIWHFCLCYAYLSNYVIFVMFSACEMFICHIMLSLWVFFLPVKCLFARSYYLCGYFFWLCNVYLSDHVIFVVFFCLCNVYLPEYVFFLLV